MTTTASLPYSEATEAYSESSRYNMDDYDLVEGYLGEKPGRGAAYAWGKTLRMSL